ncbi:MAG TPA: hypothetical protein VGX94_01305 [Terriglobia bacterium]|nr:hypothetical protein [Terriglobia bacterium]
MKWQAFLLWVRAIEEAEDETLKCLAEIVNKRCPSLPRFGEPHNANDRRTSSPLWYHLEQWINERIFAKPRREGWMDAVGYYAVRDLAALRDEAYWCYCDRQWKISKPVGYPTFQEWRKASEQCEGEVLDNFETTDELRELVKLSRRVRPRTLRKTADHYVECQIFAYSVRAAFDREGSLPVSLRRELRRSCPGFLEGIDSLAGGEGEEPGHRFSRLVHWIEEHEFTRARKEGWLPVLLYQARLHPRHQRLLGYWNHGQVARSKRPQYSSFVQWTAAVDAYTFEPERT